jgi:hypothetical protein
VNKRLRLIRAVFYYVLIFSIGLLSQSCKPGSSTTNNVKAIKSDATSLSKSSMIGGTSGAVAGSTSSSSSSSSSTLTCKPSSGSFCAGSTMTNFNCGCGVPGNGWVDAGSGCYHQATTTPCGNALSKTCTPSNGSFCSNSQETQFSCNCGSPGSDWVNAGGGCYHKATTVFCGGAQETSACTPSLGSFCSNNQETTYSCNCGNPGTGWVDAGGGCFHKATGNSCNKGAAVTFPDAVNFTFRGYAKEKTSTTPFMNVFDVCASPSGTCYSGKGAIWPSTNAVLDNGMAQIESGAAVRGNMANPTAYEMPFNTMEVELHTNDFFSKNPGAHIAIGPMALLPYEVSGTAYNGYPKFPVISGINLPYAIGNNIILGSVPCKNGIEAKDERPGVANGFRDDLASLTNGVAIEHLLGPYPQSDQQPPANKTWCPLKVNENVASIFADNSVYRIRVAIKQGTCASAGVCRWVGYTVEKQNGSSYVMVTKGGGDNLFPDKSAAAVTQTGWNTLKNEDRAKFYIAHVFSSALQTADASWSFEVKNIKVDSSNTAPAWWNK